MFILKQVDEKMLFISIFLGLFAVAAGGPAEASGGVLCADAAPLNLNATVRGFAADEEQGRFRLEVETPGIVTLEVAAVGEAAVSPRLGLLTGSHDPIVIEESATHLAFAVRRPGNFCVRVAAQDPRRPLGAYKFTAHFVEAEVRDQELAGELGWFRTVETTFYASGIPSKAEDHEVDPDPSRVELGRQPLVSLVTLTGAAALKEEDHEVDPDPVRVHLEPGRILARVVLLHGGDDLLKEEDHEVDPDPVRVEIEPQRRWTALVTFPADLAAKEEDHEVDPDPVRIHVEPGRLIRFAAVDDGSAQLRAGSPEERAALVTWIAGRIWPELSAAGERFRLLAYGSLDEAPLLRPELGRRCRWESDDHGDTFACATPVALGRPISAEIGNGWGDDEDVYRFRLLEMATLAVEAVGEADPAI
ncbi:MAG: hypothetical protein GY856_10120, partial [bacterium]|nr:hypothetical protein [bacterium]